MHPLRLRCSSFKYSRYSQSSRLAGRVPRPSRCDARPSSRAVNARQRVEAVFSPHRPKRNPQEAGLSLRPAPAFELCAPLHRRRDDRGSDRGGKSGRSARHADLARPARRERHQPRGGDGGDARLPRRHQRDHRVGDRAEHLAEADAARARRRSRVRGRQPPQDPRERRPGRVLGPHRHGELALHRSDARHLRDAVGPRLHPARRRAAVDATRKAKRLHTRRRTTSTRPTRG